MDFEVYGSGRPLGMVVIDGRLVKSPDCTWNADLWVRHDGTTGIGTETWHGAYNAILFDSGGSTQMVGRRRRYSVHHREVDE